MGAGLNSNIDRMRLRASSERCPPLSSVSDSFHTPLNATRTSRPSSTVQPSGGSSLAVVPGSNVEKMLAKSRPTFSHVDTSTLFLVSSSSLITRCSRRTVVKEEVSTSQG